MNLSVLVESVFKQMAAENRARKAAAAAAYKEQKKQDLKEYEDKKYRHIANIINAEVSNHYPDADPFDAIANAVQKHYGSAYKNGDVLNALDIATKRHLGSKSYNDYVDDFHKQYSADNG